MNNANVERQMTSLTQFPLGMTYFASYQAREPHAELNFSDQDTDKGPSKIANSG